jgi:hypothetical protein
MYEVSPPARGRGPRQGVSRCSGRLPHSPRPSTLDASDHPARRARGLSRGGASESDGVVGCLRGRLPTPVSGQYARPVLAFGPPLHEVVEVIELVMEYGLLAAFGAVVGAGIGYFSHDEDRLEWTLTGAAVGAIVLVIAVLYFVG